MTTELEAQASAGVIPTLPPELISPRPYDLATARLRNEAIARFCEEFLKKGDDYTVLENFDRPALGKAGAEKLAIFCGLEPRISIKDETLDFTGEKHGGEPFFYCLYRFTMLVGGKVVGEGEGSCNSWEQKYRWRWIAESSLPSTFDKSSLHVKEGGIGEWEFAIRKAQTTGKYGKPAAYWTRFLDAIDKKTARRSVRTLRDSEETYWEIDAKLYRVPNPDNPDIVNTVQKIAQKRAFICAVIQATGVSNLFSQDIDDMPPEVLGDRGERKAEAKQTKKADPPRQTRQQESRQPEPAKDETATQRTQQPAKSEKSEAERHADMVVAFEDLRKRSGNDAWYRRSLDFANADSFTLQVGVEKYRAMMAFVETVHRIDEQRKRCDRSIYDRALFAAGITDLWRAADVTVLQGVASALQEGGGQ